MQAGARTQNKGEELAGLLLALIWTVKGWGWC
jgi:hypothetical protein